MVSISRLRCCSSRTRSRRSACGQTDLWRLNSLRRASSGRCCATMHHQCAHVIVDFVLAQPRCGSTVQATSFAGCSLAKPPQAAALCLQIALGLLLMPPFVSVTTIILSHAKPIMVGAMLRCCPHTLSPCTDSIFAYASWSPPTSGGNHLLAPTRHNFLLLTRLHSVAGRLPLAVHTGCTAVLHDHLSCGHCTAVQQVCTAGGWQPQVRTPACRHRCNWLPGSTSLPVQHLQNRGACLQLSPAFHKNITEGLCFLSHAHKHRLRSDAPGPAGPTDLLPW